MLYLPWRLRRQSEPCSPRGPSFSRAVKTVFKVDGTQVSIRAPRHRSTGTYYSLIEPKRSYVTEEHDHRRIQWENLVGGREGWEYFPVMRRVWDFYGPMLTGRRGDVDLSLYVTAPVFINDDVSLFHPRAFEGKVADLLSYRCFSGEDAANQTQRWSAPVGWCPLEGFGEPHVTFDVRPTDEHHSSSWYRYFIAPISDKQLLVASFRLARTPVFGARFQGRELSLNEWIDERPLVALVDQVMASIEIALSEKSQAQLSKVREQCGDVALSPDFPPINWLDEKSGEDSESMALPAGESS